MAGFTLLQRREFVLALIGGLAASAAAARERIAGLPCEGCDAVFVQMPPSIPTQARIAPAAEPGEAMHVQGLVLDTKGGPVPGVIVYAYHTNAGGIYPRDPSLNGSSADRHGRLRSWVRSDAQGRYRFDTIRPGGYPGSGVPQHIHLHVIEPDRCTYYIDDIVFRDDPRLAPHLQRYTPERRGGDGITVPERDSEGVWQVTRDIRLGMHIGDYKGCAAS